MESGAFRFFGDWESAMRVVRQRKGVLRKGPYSHGWNFLPDSKHPIDTLSDEEREFVRTYRTFNGCHITLDEVRTTHWKYLESLVSAIRLGGGMGGIPTYEDEFEGPRIRDQEPREESDYPIDSDYDSLGWPTELLSEFADYKDDAARSSEDGWYYSDEDEEQ